MKKEFGAGMHLTKSLQSFLIILVFALFVTACGAGNAANDGNNETRADQMAGGITGKSITGTNNDGNARNAGKPGMLPGNGQRSPFPPDAVQPLNNPDRNSAGHRKLMQQRRGTMIPFVNLDDGQYIAAQSIVKLLEFKHTQFHPDTRTYEIGDNDVFMRIRVNSREAEKAGIPFTLSAPPKMSGGKLLLTKSAAADLFQEEMVFDVTPEGIIVYPYAPHFFDGDNDGAENVTVDEALDFGEEPSHPFAGQDDASEGVFLNEAAEAQAVPALKNIDINALIDTAKSYLGVKYEFGASPYARSNRFDCSSYTQYVYGKYGIDLPGTARQQMDVGNTVSRQSLRKGDLLFFCVPGRFKSGKVAGRVGIYIGNRQMIIANSEPSGGVQICSIDNGFYKKTFLAAKRVAY